MVLERSMEPSLLSLNHSESIPEVVQPRIVAVEEI